MAKKPEADTSTITDKRQTDLENTDQGTSDKPQSTALQAAASAGFMVGAEGAVKVKRRVTVPVLPFADGMTIIVRAIDAIHKGKEIKETANGKPRMGVAMIMTIEAPNGSQRTLICGEVLQKELAEAYPKDAYVGCWFMLTKIAPRPGKQYATYEIVEIEAPNRLAA